MEQCNSTLHKLTPSAEGLGIASELGERYNFPSEIISPPADLLRGMRSEGSHNMPPHQCTPLLNLTQSMSMENRVAAYL
jgi:hypothetical protein